MAAHRREAQEIPAGGVHDGPVCDCQRTDLRIGDEIAAAGGFMP